MFFILFFVGAFSSYFYALNVNSFRGFRSAFLNIYKALSYKYIPLQEKKVAFLFLADNRSSILALSYKGLDTYFNT